MTFTSKGETPLIDKIFNGDLPFNDGGTLEVIERFREGADIPVIARWTTRICLWIRCRPYEDG